MMIGDVIRVGVVFGGRPQVRPVWFLWNGREVRIREVTYTWRTQEGRAVVRHFAVTDGANCYELRYDTGEMGWRLASIEETGESTEIPNPKSQIPRKSQTQNSKTQTTNDDLKTSRPVTFLRHCGTETFQDRFSVASVPSVAFNSGTDAFVNNPD